MAFKWISAIASQSFTLKFNGAPTLHTSLFPANNVRSFVHLSPYASGIDLPPKDLQKKRERLLARMRETNRRRYQEDSEYRERLLRGCKQKYANESQYRERNDLRSTKAYLERKSILVHNPKAYQLLRDQVTERVKAIYHNKAGYRWNQVLAGRLRLTPRYCDEVVWASHKPVLYPAKTNHTCATCGRKRHGGLKLWWRRKNEPEKYDCMRCFGADREASTPIHSPLEFSPLPDRGPVQGPPDHDEKGDEGSGTGATK